MSLVPQVQFQLFGRPSWLAGLWTLEASGSGHVLAGTIAPTSLTCAVNVFQPRSIGSNLLEDQPAGLQFISVPHAEPSADETMSLTEQTTLCATTIHKSRNQRAGR